MSSASLLGRIKPSADRMADGVGVVSNSVRLLLDRPILLAYPLLGGLLSVGLLVGATVGTWLLWPISWWLLPLIAVATYFAMAYVIVLSIAALIHEVRDYHRDVPLSLRAGFGAALGRAGTLLWWSGLVATIGTFLSLVADRQDTRKGQILGRLMELGWSAGTFFVTPAILFRNAGPFSMFLTSADVLGDHWQEIAGSIFGLRVVAYVTSLLGGSVAILLAGVGMPGPLAVLIGGPLILLGVLVDLTLQGVVKATLWDHLDRVEAGETSEHGVDIDDLGGVFDDKTPDSAGSGDVA